VEKLAAGDPAPEVILKLTNTLTSISIGGGSGAQNVEANAKLAIYAPGDISIAGNANFHHDEALANVGGNNPFRVSLRRELTTAAQRHAVHRRVPRTARRGFAAPCADRAGAAGTSAITGHCKPCAMAPPWAAPA
jgi:hypothetical protein